MDPNNPADTGNAELDDTFEDHDAGNLEDDDFATDEGDYDDLDDDFELEADDDDADLDDDQAAEDDPEDDQDANAEVMVDMDDGEQIALSELRSGYMKSQDYTQKTTELADERKIVAEQRDALAQRGQYVEQTLTNLLGFVETLVPPKPSLELAQSDPQQYQYQAALRENAIAELQPLLQAGETFKQAKSDFAQGDLDDFKSAEDAKLLKAMPHLKDEKKRSAFDSANMQTALEFGFSEEEIGGATDHRILQLVHFARLGKKAAQNRANAKRRVQKPQKGQKVRGSSTTKRQAAARSAVERLAETGSIDDAVSALSIS